MRALLGRSIVNGAMGSSQDSKDDMNSGVHSSQSAPSSYCPLSLAIPPLLRSLDNGEGLEKCHVVPRCVGQDATVELYVMGNDSKLQNSKPVTRPARARDSAIPNQLVPSLFLWLFFWIHFCASRGADSHVTLPGKFTVL